jgi:thioredoxin reductase (NADPH)
MNNKEEKKIEEKKVEQETYDLIVIGGGSGGIAAAKEAAKLGAKTALFDYVKPSTQGTTWKIGGTCVNVGCIPKKLYHTSSIYAEHILDSTQYGWKVASEDFEENKKKYFDWNTLKESVQTHIHSLNFKYPNDLKKSKVTVFNELVKFIDKDTIEGTDKKGNKKIYKSKYFLIAVGGRPQVPDNVKGAKEFAITSDDIFSLEKEPGKTLCVGASYVSLECAGFLRGLGFDVSVMVRSIILRGFDRECSDKIREKLEEMGIKFYDTTTPLEISKLENGKLLVDFIKNDTNEKSKEEFDTIFFATGF